MGLVARAADRFLHLDEIRAAAEAEGVDPLLLTAMVRVESGFRPGAVSPRGARGLAQLMPGTAREVAGGAFDDTRLAQVLQDPAWNLRLGARYFRLLQDRFGDTAVALAAYNGGPSAVADYLGGDTATVKDLRDFPKGETRRYVKKVLRTYEVLRRLKSWLSP